MAGTALNTLEKVAIAGVSIVTVGVLYAFYPGGLNEPLSKIAAQPQTAVEQPETAVSAEVADAPAETVVTPAPAIEAPEIVVIEPASPEVAPAATPLRVGFRVDPEGMALIAGTGQAGSTLAVMLDGVEVTRGSIDAFGNFAIFADIPPSEDDRVLSVMSDPDGAQTEDPNRFIIAGVVVAPQSDGESTDEQVSEAPVVIAAQEDTVKVIQSPSTQNAPAHSTVLVDSIGYDSTGEVQLAGRAPNDGNVRIYIDGAIVSDAPVADGAWGSDLPNVDPGTYTLRIDEVSADGDVTSRVELPFKRETPEVLAEVAQNQASFTSKTVQPGATLWAIAEERYGNGVFYLKVFEANRAAIDDPDLIYPGQVFTIPE